MNSMRKRRDATVKTLTVATKSSQLRPLLAFGECAVELLFVEGLCDEALGVGVLFLGFRLGVDGRPLCF